jgi:4-carboxymuconolactone decarboxylase
MCANLLEGYVKGALSLKAVSLAEWREAALHFAVYGGWSRGAIMDAAITRAAQALGLEAASFPPSALHPGIRPLEWPWAKRISPMS